MNSVRYCLGQGLLFISIVTGGACTVIGGLVMMAVLFNWATGL